MKKYLIYLFFAVSCTCTAAGSNCSQLDSMVVNSIETLVNCCDNDLRRIGVNEPISFYLRKDGLSRDFPYSLLDERVKPYSLYYPKALGKELIDGLNINGPKLFFTLKLTLAGDVVEVSLCGFYLWYETSYKRILFYYLKHPQGVNTVTCKYKYSPTERMWLLIDKEVPEWIPSITYFRPCPTH